MNIGDSLDQIMPAAGRPRRRREVIGEKFYEVFFNRHPEVKTFFANLNLKRQAALVTSALLVLERYYTSPNHALKQYLQILGTRHNDWKIPRDHYPYWREAMLETLATFHGDNWSDELQRQWTAAIDQASKVMLEGYEQRFHT